MRETRNIQIKPDSREEILPDFTEGFPYLASRACLSRYPEPGTPWHWHRAVELFYVEQGVLEYHTPAGKSLLPAGFGGFVNSNVLHSSRVISGEMETVQLLHLFEPEFISEGGSVIAEKYIRPLALRRDIELIVFSPEEPRHTDILKKIRGAFDLKGEDWGYEITLRGVLADIWLSLLELAGESVTPQGKNRETEEKLKRMMAYIQTYYPEPITVETLAKAALVSKRVCYRIFKETLHMSPVEYMTDFRMDKACRQLTETNDPITKIAYDCGLGSSSYFGKCFRQHIGCTPAQYRRKWHESEK